MMVMANFGAAQAAEKSFRHIGASSVQAVGFLVIDALHFKAGVKVIPSVGIVGIDDGSFGNPRPDKIQRLSFGAEHGGKRIAIALTNDDNALALA